MKIHYQHLLRFIKEKVSIKDLSEFLFQLGHENEIENEILDIEFTPNRGDCLSLLGLSRDLNGLIETSPKVKIFDGEIDTLNLDFENKSQKDCPNISFLMLEIDEEVIHYENYLESFFKDLNNNKNNFFTDVSNYIAYELGQPTHCFDLDKLNGRIIFSKEKTNETFETLLGKSIELKGNNCIFSNNGNIISLAGVMGGKSSACSKGTKKVLIECANFKPDSIIGKSLQYNLQSESSYRFERGVDPTCHEKVLRRFIKIVQDHTDIVKMRYVAFEKEKYQRKELKIDLSKVNAILGTSINKEEYKKILLKLGFEIGENIKVPFYRNDINSQNDLAEEVARVIGYNNISSQPLQINKIHNNTSDKELNKLRFFLVSKGFYEVINFPFVDRSNKNSISVDNPLDSNKKFLRNDLQDSLVQNLLYNERRQNDSLKFFEISNLYDADSSENKTRIGIIVSGVQGHNYREFTKKIDRNYMAQILSEAIDTKELQIVEIMRNDLDTKIKNRIFFCEFDVKDIIVNCSVEPSNSGVFPPYSYTPISEFPSSNRDFSFLINDFSNLEDIYFSLDNLKHKYLKDSFMFDFYKNSKKNELKIGYRLVFQSDIKTLSDEEIQNSVDEILSPILSMHGISLPSI